MGKKRTDPHRPGAIIPGEYHCVFSYNLATTMEGWPVPSLGVNCEMDYRTEERNEKGDLIKVINGKHRSDGKCCIMHMMATGQKFASTGGTGQCSVCSTHFIYGDVWQHEPTGEHIHIGHECAHKYGLMADRSAWELEFNRRKKAMAVEIEKKMRAEERAAFLEQHPGLEEALAEDHPILHDLAQKFMGYRSLSPKQIELAHKLAHQVRNPPPAEKFTTAPEGRVTFLGEVVSKKSHEGAYGLSFKMTVKVTTEDGVWLAWGTCPDNLLSLANDGKPLQRGDIVKVTATLKPGKDPHFAMMKRPIASRIDEKPLFTPEEA